MDDKAFGALLIEVEHRHDPSKNLLLQTERSAVVMVASFLAPAARKRCVELCGELGEDGLGGFLSDCHDLLAQKIALQQEDEENLSRLEGDEVEVLDPRL